MTIFFISALAHEYIISVAMMRLSIWTFTAMFLQFFIIITEKFFLKLFKLADSQIGNFAFWISFCIVGQPALIVTYSMDYIHMYGLPRLPTTG